MKTNRYSKERLEDLVETHGLGNLYLELMQAREGSPWADLLTMAIWHHVSKKWRTIQ